MSPERTAAVKAKYPRLAAAESAWADPVLQQKLKVLLLADCQVDEIAWLTKLDPEVVTLVEELWYDVRGSRRASRWVRHHIIGPEEDAGNIELAARLKFALVAGAASARVALEAEGQELAAQLHDRKLQRQLEAGQPARRSTDRPTAWRC